MPARKSSVKNEGRNGARTWIELDSKAVKRNIETFRRLIGQNIKLWAVVKSNAYGHGLPVFPELADKFGVDGFCVDSAVEGFRLREGGVKKPILVLGFTLPERMEEAAGKDITITISNQESFKALSRAKRKPFYHLKIDTGMHRQGFYPEDVAKMSKYMDSKLSGVYSHFASAKDMKNPVQSSYTENQFNNFKNALSLLEKKGFSNLTKHISASAGTIVSPEYHLDAVRVGIGLYGLWPSRRLKAAFSEKIRLEPVLSWKTIISEIKTAKTGGYVGYDMTEKITRPTRYALLPVGYWHGLSRLLSGRGEVLIKGKRARILGRVSMDMAVVDVSKINCKPGDIVTIIGKSGRDELTATEMAELSGTSHYEFLTRLNPLMEKIVV
ncbi:MAG: alanine racemase [Candidatus Liptonbacteria bacterium]|nr:alanine racemase [Candidatus Liptonbacteria bacterium]